CSHIYGLTEVGQYDAQEGSRRALRNRFVDQNSAAGQELITDDSEHRLRMRLPHADKRAVRPIFTDQPWIHVIQTWQRAPGPAPCHTMQQTRDQASIFRS